MLSPHEFAVLMLVKSSPDQTDVHREEFDTLLARQLVALDNHPVDGLHPRVTHDGESLLQALARKR